MYNIHHFYCIYTTNTPSYTLDNYANIFNAVTSNTILFKSLKHFQCDSFVYVDRFV